MTWLLIDVDELVEFITKIGGCHLCARMASLQSIRYGVSTSGVDRAVEMYLEDSMEQ